MITYTCDLCDIEIQGAMSTTHSTTNSGDQVLHFHLDCWTYLFRCGGLDAAQHKANQDLDTWEQFTITDGNRELGTHNQELNDRVFQIVETEGITTLSRIFDMVSMDVSNDDIADAVSRLLRTNHVKVSTSGRVPLIRINYY